MIAVNFVVVIVTVEFVWGCCSHENDGGGGDSVHGGDILQHEIGIG